MSDAPPSQPSLRIVVLLIAASVPLALGVETLLRKLVFVPLMGAELEEIREYYWPSWGPEARRTALTEAAWVLAIVTFIAGIVGVALARRVRGDREGVRDRLLLLTSIPQVPALLATLCFCFGAALLPVAVSLLASTAFVVAQGWLGER
jgi:hypothetical protein